ncbi:MAG: metalloendopeptidase, partial [Planctomycetota bacterium]
MRTSLFAGLFFAFSSALASAQDKAELAPRRQLHDYLIECCQKHFDERRQTVADLKSPDGIRKRQEALKAKFFESIGPLPAKTPLSAKVVGTLKGNGFRVEKVIYESRPNHHVTANLYLPDEKGPVPAVLVPCGH